eukprot:TRINITY_DN49829_c0_g2_i1.p1 TRINITY_DN49829_c0_g2~~TRINITY_DN49829_c0_g2_i1.p1  ORF type:complete len:199 (+),score=28.06 TRINITY_DN49829_c0_g2_i1:25-621(+)
MAINGKQKTLEELDEEWEQMLKEENVNVQGCFDGIITTEDESVVRKFLRKMKEDTAPMWDLDVKVDEVGKQEEDGPGSRIRVCVKQTRMQMANKSLAPTVARIEVDMQILGWVSTTNLRWKRMAICNYAAVLPDENHISAWNNLRKKRSQPTWHSHISQQQDDGTFELKENTKELLPIWINDCLEDLQTFKGQVETAE